MEHRKLRVGMVGGGGPANFFGAPHRRAILMDNAAELTAGALRSNPEESIAAAKELFYTRPYGTWQDMVAGEAALPPNERIDYVTIVTPNDTHYPVAKAFLEVGIPVLCEKPLTMNMAESQDLVRIVRETGLPFTVAYTYTALPMVMLARELVRSGEIGEVRKVEAWYQLGWLASRDDEASKQAHWRIDPKRAGASSCGGDIGTHAYEFVHFVTGTTATEVSARLKTFMKHRPLDDDFTVLARLDNGGLATITATQISIGAQNDNGFRVVGTQGTLQWGMLEHLSLKNFRKDQTVIVYRLGGGNPFFPDSIKPYLRLPGGHPEGFHEALANLHMTHQLRVRRFQGQTDVPEPYPLPDVMDGAAGIAFVEAAVQSSADSGAWTKVAPVG